MSGFWTPYRDSVCSSSLTGSLNRLSKQLWELYNLGLIIGVCLYYAGPIIGFCLGLMDILKVWHELRCSAEALFWGLAKINPNHVHISHVQNVLPSVTVVSLYSNKTHKNFMTAKPVIRNLTVTILDMCEWVMLNVVLYHNKVYLCLLCMGPSQALLAITTLPCTISYGVGIVYKSHIS